MIYLSDALPGYCKEFWQKAVSERGIVDDGNLRVLISIPGSDALADELVDLYLKGEKTAASGLVLEYKKSGDPLPSVGDYWIVLNRTRQPRVLVKTIRVVVNKFKDVTEDIARAEGEGDKTLKSWRDGHEKFFLGQQKVLGFKDLSEEEVVTEFFEVVFQTLY
jgi:uncharacterized protein YhfF